MLLHQGETKHEVRVLLDTGCSIALVNEKTVRQLKMGKKEHRHPRTIENYTGEKVPGAGQYYTEAIKLQHRKHYSWEKFEISVMDPHIDIFLPFGWNTAHPPQGAWTNEEVRFNSPQCLENCTRAATNDFSLSWDESVLSDPEAKTIGYVSAIQEDTGKQVPLEFRQFMGIMSKEAADSLPEHRQYDCKIDLKEGAHHRGDQYTRYRRWSCRRSENGSRKWKKQEKSNDLRHQRGPLSCSSQHRTAEAYDSAWIIGVSTR